MTDPMDDLRQASAAASGVQILSPAAQSVLDAALQVSNLSPTVSVAAATLRAAADQDETLLDPFDEWLPPVRAVRTDKLLAIVNELEAQ